MGGGVSNRREASAAALQREVTPGDRIEVTRRDFPRGGHVRQAEGRPRDRLPEGR